MRFDDSLKTVLAGDIDSGIGAAAAWRQLVDLMGRGRFPADEPAIARLRLLRQAVPLDVRAASGRALAFATPGAALVGLFAEDVLSVSAPVLRTAILPGADWIAMLSRLSPEGRSILRHRRDLPGEVLRGLESFGPIDFILDYDSPAADDIAAPVSAATLPANDVAPSPAPIDLPPPPPGTPLSETPFVALGQVAQGIPIVAEALRRADPPATPPQPARFEIADLVERIAAFNRRREAGEADEPVSTQPPQPATSFGYATDAAGVICWVDGVSRAALVGASFAYGAPQGEVRVDAVMAGALRQRARFTDARLDIGGLSDAAGSWRVSGVPLFDAHTGRFTGFQGTARRPRPDEQAERKAVSDSLRQLVHELRTPTNAIAGFAELIEAQLLGPVTPNYRDHAIAIRRQANSLLAAIDDLDTAARIEGEALELRSTRVALRPLIARIADELKPLARLRGAKVKTGHVDDVAVDADDRIVERLFARLLAALASAAGEGERIVVSSIPAPAGSIGLALTRPAALDADTDETALSDDATENGAPLLGIAFALRLARNIATELGGQLVIEPERLTLRLPAALDRAVERASN